MFRIKIDVTGVQKELQDLFNNANDLSIPMQDIGEFGAEQARTRLAERPEEWHPHTGRLADSLTVTTEKDSHGTAAVVSSDLIYARIQQEGGTIRPIRGKFLAIPIPDFLAKQGILARNYPGKLKFKRAVQIRIGTKAWTGPALVIPGTGAASDRPMYALIKKAVIKARPYLIWDERWADFAEKRLLDYIVEGA